MVMKAAPSAAFEVAEPQFLFELLVVAFDDPSLFRQGHQVTQLDAFGQIG